MNPLDLIMVLFVFAIWSYVLWRENIVYDFAEKTFIAVSAGHSVMLGLTTLWNQDLARIATGETILIIPTILGLTYLLRLSKGYAWVSRYSTALIIGTILSMNVRTLPYNFESQLKATMLNLSNPNNIVIVVAAATTIFYYYFRRKPGMISDTLAKIGRGFIMSYIGAAAAGTLLTRQAYLTERVSFILKAFGII